MTARLLAAYDRWLFRAFDVDAKSLAIFRALFAGTLLAMYVPRGTAAAELPLFFSPPVCLAAAWEAPQPPAVVFVLNAALTAALACLLVGFRTRAASLWTAALILALQSIGCSLGKIDHGVLLCAAPAFLAFSRWGDAYSVDAAAGRARGDVPARKRTGGRGWPLATFAVFLGLSMATAGWAKLTTGWLDLSTHATHGHLLKNAYVYDRSTAAGEWVLGVRSGVLLELMDWSAVAMELAFAVAFVSRRAFAAALVAAASFHVGVQLGFGICFWPNCLIYGAFVPWSRLAPATAGGWLPRRPAARALAAAALIALGTVRLTATGWVPGEPFAWVQRGLVFAAGLVAAWVAARWVWQHVPKPALTAGRVPAGA